MRNPRRVFRLILPESNFFVTNAVFPVRPFYREIQGLLLCGHRQSNGGRQAKLEFRCEQVLYVMFPIGHGFLLPNVKDEPRRDLARGVPFVTKSFRKPFLHDS